MLYSEGSKLVFRYDDHVLWIEPWGENAFRVRASKLAYMPQEDWALSEKPVDVSSKVKIETPQGKSATITNGNIRAEVSHRGKVVMYDGSGKKLLEEYARHRLDLEDPKCSALEIEARELKGLLGGDFQATLRLESRETLPSFVGRLGRMYSG